MKILVIFLTSLSFMLILSMIPLSYGQIDNFCWPIPLQKEVKMSEMVFVGNLISTTNHTNNRIVVLDVEQIIKGDVPDSLKIHLDSNQIIESDVKIENDIQVPIEDFSKFRHPIPYEPQKWIIFIDLDYIESQIGCNTNSGELNYDAYDSGIQQVFLSGNGVHRMNILNYFLSENPPPPLKQINAEWNLYGDYICTDKMVHVRSHSWNWACVTTSTAEKLVERGGWISLGY